VDSNPEKTRATSDAHSWNVAHDGEIIEHLDLTRRQFPPDAARPRATP